MDSLCDSCAHVRQVESGSGSKFLLCRMSDNDNRYPKYPSQPVFRCRGYADKRMATTGHTLEILPGEYAVCRLDADAELPGWPRGELVSVTRTVSELSIVCRREDVPDAIRRELGWRCLRVAGDLDFSLVGVISALTGVLAAANVSVFVVSTFDTDFLLVKKDDLAAAVASLLAEGHAIRYL